jgi:hypothetical protein
LVRASRRFGALFSVDTRLDVLPWILGRVFWCGKGDHALFQRVEISLDETVVSSEMNKHVVEERLFVQHLRVPDDDETAARTGDGDV